MTGHGRHDGDGSKNSNHNKATPGQSHREVQLTPPHLSPHPETTPAPPSPTSVEIRPSTDTITPPPRTAHTMRQVLDEIKYLRVARSTLKGETVDLIHRLAELEKETLRSEQPSELDVPQAPAAEPTQPQSPTQPAHLSTTCQLPWRTSRHPRTGRRLGHLSVSPRRSPTPTPTGPSV